MIIYPGKTQEEVKGKGKKEARGGGGTRISRKISP